MPASLPPGSRVLPSGFCGVCHVRSVFCSFGLFCGAFRALPACALGWAGPGRLVPLLVGGAVRRGRGGALCVARRRRWVCPLLVAPLAGGLLRLPGARRSRCCWRCAVVGGFCSGRAAARSCSPGWRVAPLGRRVRRPLLCGGLAVARSLSLPPVAASAPLALPLLVASCAGCRRRWLARAGARCLVVRCGSPLLAAFLCRRARLFGLPPVRAGRSGRLVLLPAARVAPLLLSARLAGLSAPARPGRVVSLAQGRLF